jgi:hypothetical protein
MNFSKFGLVIGTVLMMTGCVNANVSVPSACDSQVVSFPVTGLPAVPPGFTCNSVPIPPGESTPPYSTTQKFDFSGALNQNTAGVVVTAQITQLVLNNANGDLSWAPSLEVDITGATPTTPKVKLATYTAPSAGAGSNIDVTVVLDANTILAYLKSGQVVLTFTIGSAPITSSLLCQLQSLNGSVSTTANVCVSAQASVTKSL